MELPGLRRVREAALLTQAELAERVGVQRVTISRIETGATRARISTVRRIATALGVPAADLMADEPSRRTSPRRRTSRAEEGDR